MSQYVVSVESSSPIHHRFYPGFVCFLCKFIDGVGNPHANQVLRNSADAKSAVFSQ